MGIPTRRSVHTLLDFGTRVGLSTVEAGLSTAERARLRSLLERLIDPWRDRVHIYPFRTRCEAGVERLGLPWTKAAGAAMLI
jgi:CRISPR/Cas system-associated endoribonuclease Cas2